MPPSTKPMIQMKILILEDNPDDLFVFQEYLRLSGLVVTDVFHAFTLSDALGQIITKKPDLIIMDLHLQDSSGLPTFNSINAAAPETPIIVLSGLNDLDAALKTIGMGAQDYLLKGEFDEKLLAKTIQYSMERKNNILEGNRKRELMMRKKLEMQKTITNVIIQTQEKERKEIGLELHDNINQILASANICLSMLQNGDGDKRDLLLTTSSLISKAIDEIRYLTKTLTPYTLQYIGLEEAILELISNLTINRSISIRLCSFNKEIEKESGNRKLNLYRIAQEQLNNIIKHSKATEAEIYFSIENDSITMLIEDNGIGFEPDKMVHGNGFYNIGNRVDAHKGEMQLITSSGTGVKLKIVFPKEVG